MLVEELPNEPLGPNGPDLWCVHCSQEVQTKLRLVGYVTLYRCRRCGNWIKCAKCAAVRSSEHACDVLTNK